MAYWNKHRLPALLAGMLLLSIAAGCASPERMAAPTPWPTDSAETRQVEAAAARLDDLIRQKRADLYAEFSPGMSAAAIAELEKRHELVLPTAVKAIYRKHAEAPAYFSSMPLVPLEKALAGRTPGKPILLLGDPQSAAILYLPPVDGMKRAKLTDGEFEFIGALSGGTLIFRDSTAMLKALADHFDQEVDAREADIELETSEAILLENGRVEEK